MRIKSRNFEKKRKKKNYELLAEALLMIRISWIFQKQLSFRYDLTWLRILYQNYCEHNQLESPSIVNK